AGRGCAVPPRVGALTARRGDCRQLPGARPGARPADRPHASAGSPMSPRHGDPAAWFADLAATHARCFWLDGGGSRDWSGSRSLVGALADDDVSISYDAATRTV